MSLNKGMTKDIDSSCRLPLMVLFISAAVWLVIASVFGLIASLKFHSPQFLAGSAWLTYGRVRPAYLDSMLYGFCLQAGLGVALWLLARLGRAALAQRWLVTVGAMVWNLGVTVGVIGVLAGDSTGFENLEFPFYAAVLVFLGYLVLGIWGVMTFHQRRERRLFVSQWFLFAALFWFPWIYSTAYMLLTKFPVRGVEQAVIAWWYSENLFVVWLGLVGIGAVFYFVPKLTGRELRSHYLAMFAFWTLVLFASWGGIPSAAPVPAWMPALSTVATTLAIVPLLGAAVNVWRTVRPPNQDTARSPALSSPSPPEEERENSARTSSSTLFILFGVVALLLAGLLKAAIALLDASQTLQFTWLVSAWKQLQFYGFFAMVMFGAVYYILPRLTGEAFPRSGLVRAHFWMAAVGIVLLVLSLAAGGVVEAMQLQDATVPFAKIMKTMLHFLRMSTTGELLLFIGHLLFLGNLVLLAHRFYRARAAAAYARVTADLFQTAEAKP